MTDNNVLIRVENLKKHYNDGAVKALNGIDCEIKKGEVVVIDENFAVRITNIINPQDRLQAL